MGSSDTGEVEEDGVEFVDVGQEFGRTVGQLEPDVTI